MVFCRFAQKWREKKKFVDKTKDQHKDRRQHADRYVCRYAGSIHDSDLCILETTQKESEIVRRKYHDGEICHGILLPERTLTLPGGKAILDSNDGRETKNLPSSIGIYVKEQEMEK